ncbi:MAG TPA: AI-2E family transporter [Ktedonobacteraceae bacterium]|nr:AI-2E family transporter [Ktedonobacteraceae bacterium]HZU68356.1 AI-2E family transporter [Ktedonobacteraceae bacterium]
MSSDTRPRNIRDVDSVAVIAKWIRRCGLPLAILAWTGVALLILWLAGHVIQTLLLLTIAALLAYALAPAVKLLERVMPRFLAILIVYLIVLGLLSVLLYLIVRTAIEQFIALSGYVRFLLTPGKSGQLTPLEQTVRSLGISQSQIDSARDQIVASIEGFAGSVVPLLTGLVGALLDVILVAVLSIYLLASGSRVSDWLRRNMPDQQQGAMRFLLDTLQRVVGGYIRGQLILCGLIGLLVGVGMQIIGVPFALLLGVLAFALEFIPVLGTLVSGAICVLLALTRGWVFAVIVLVYFVVVHVLEGDVVGPRIVGKTIGLHPVVSLAALIAGAELFGIAGALLASPVAGVLQALLIAIWSQWRVTHPGEFRRAKDDMTEKVEETVTETPGDPEPTMKSLS